MTVRTLPVPLDAGRALCSDPVHLPLVDAATARPGGPDAQVMKATLCRQCPVVQQCHDWAMAHGEAGIWGATSPGYRSRRGAPKRLTSVDHTWTEGVPAQEWRRKSRPARKSGVPRTPNAGAIRCAQLGVRESDVRRWAYEQGIVASNAGRPALATVEAWAAAHQAA